ncbi:MAG: hypothetical protein GY946_06290 [bacterium]|nr:hypothetical protein [bacterium]
MPRAPRIDFPGAWFHVMNRGVARRTIFENRTDVRYFLALLAHTVRRGDIEVHAYSLMATHCHVLARSPRARLARAMQWIQDLYARWFNRRRRRDGPLFRGRYKAKLIRDLRHRTVVLHYIHRNAVDARIVDRARDYPHASAKHYAADRGPPWLTRTFGDRLGDAAFAPPPLGRRAREITRRWIEEGAPPLEFRDLVDAAPVRVRAWMRRKQRLADGNLPSVILLHPDTVRELVAKRRSCDKAILPPRRNRGAWTVLEAGMLRAWCALSMQQIADLQGACLATISKRIRTHRDTRHRFENYTDAEMSILTEALARDHGGVADKAEGR